LDSNERSDKRAPTTIDVSEVIAAMSYALDLVEGQPEGHCVRASMLGMKLAWEIGVPDKLLAPLFYALLLKDLGCSSNAAKICYLFGADERSVKQDFKTTDWTQRSATAQYVLRNVAPQGPLHEKIERIVRLAISGQQQARELVQTRCDRGARIAGELGLPEETCAAIRSLDEHWDGQGHPEGLAESDIPILARIVSIAQTTDVFIMRDGLGPALDVIEGRSGTWFDPRLVRALLSMRNERHFWDQYMSRDPRRFVHEFEPETPLLNADEATLDRVCSAFSQVIDAKSPWTACHSVGVAEVSVGMGKILGFSPAELQNLQRAALLHDIGKLGVSNQILDKVGRLTAAEYADVKKHPAYTYEILSRVHCFEPFAKLAASHHEKLDGSGYHLGLTAKDLSPADRVLAVADFYEALAAKRPYRQDLGDQEVHRILAAEAGDKICPEAHQALIEFLRDSDFQPYELAA